MGEDFPFRIRRFKIPPLSIVKESSRIGIMLKTDEWFLIQDLHSKGFSISEISRITGYARKTVRKHLNLKTAPEPQKRLGRKSKLDPFKPYMIDKLNEGSYTAARLYREIKEMGFDGGKTIVKDFVRKVKTK
jgi:transposase